MAKPIKVIHVDMDYFFAAIEERDNPSLKTKPIAVGGAADRRGVICTSNYIARQFGVRSAMATAKALELCPQLVIIRPNIEKYREATLTIHDIFLQYTDIIEPLSLDEAYLDVSHQQRCHGSASLMAKEICQKIHQQTQLTASAGVAPNKLIAKIASNWRKPNGIFTVPPQAITDFMRDLPVNKIFGVGPVTTNKLAMLGIESCGDLQKYPLSSLTMHFGKFAYQLHEYSHGIDQRSVQNERIRKSVSVEDTFDYDLIEHPEMLEKIAVLLERLKKRLDPERAIKSCFVKIKFCNFIGTTIETSTDSVRYETFEELFFKGLQRQQKSVRLLGVGIRYKEEHTFEQLEFENFPEFTSETSL